VRRAPLLLVLLLPARVLAAEGEHALSATPSFARFSFSMERPGQPAPETISGLGGALHVDYEYGLTDTLWLRATLGAGLHRVEDGRARSGLATAGLTYAFDVLRYVPYLNLGAGVLVVDGDGFDRRIEPLVELGVGLDVLHSRSFSYGVALRFDAFASSATYFSAGLRASYRWGWF
jgi:hypothetical protein